MQLSLTSKTPNAMVLRNHRVFWWLWRSDPSSGGVNDCSFTPKGKPAANEMKSFASRQGTLLTMSDVPAGAYDKQSAYPISKHGGPWPSKENGIVVGSGEWTSFEDPLNSSRLDSAAALASLTSAKAHGINSAEFIPTWFFPVDWKRKNSTSMYRGQQTQLPSALATDTDDELRVGIAAAKRLGMRTSLSPMFDPDFSMLPWWNASSGGKTLDKHGPSGFAGGGVGRGEWGDGWSSELVDEWFGNYGTIIIDYAKLAQEAGVDAFHVGHELHTLLTNPDNEVHWRTLIRKVRAVYSGNVSVAFNGNPIFDDMDRAGVPWMDELDFIGLDCCTSHLTIILTWIDLTHQLNWDCRLADLHEC